MNYIGLMYIIRLVTVLPFQYNCTEFGTFWPNSVRQYDILEKWSLSIRNFKVLGKNYNKLITGWKQFIIIIVTRRNKISLERAHGMIWSYIKKARIYGIWDYGLENRCVLNNKIDTQDTTVRSEIKPIFHKSFFAFCGWRHLLLIG